jgi:Carboxypeptidase regulatory-like domain
MESERTMNRILALVTCAGLVTVSCGGGASQSPTSPTQAEASAATLATDIAKRYAIGGVVESVDKPRRLISGARIEVIQGAEAGSFTVSDDTGSFLLRGLSPGPMTLQVSKPGFQTWSKDVLLESDAKIEAELFAAPPSDGNGATATGRCNDGSWTWAATREEACVNTGGLAYGVCPGPLCKSR